MADSETQTATATAEVQTTTDDAPTTTDPDAVAASAPEQAASDAAVAADDSFDDYKRALKRLRFDNSINEKVKEFLCLKKDYETKAKADAQAKAIADFPGGDILQQYIDEM